MLIVGGALAFTAISVFIFWRFILTCRARWRARKAKGKHVAKDNSDIERVVADSLEQSLKADPERNPFRADHGPRI